MTKSRTDADSEVAPSLGIGTVYVSVASSPTTSMPSTKLRMSALRWGLSTRGVARELGIHRDTAKKYMEALSPPMKRDRVE